MGTELAKAYVQIVPSAQGIAGSIRSILDPEADSAGKSSGGKLGGQLVGTIKKIIGTAAIGATIKKALTEGGAMEQSMGGIETMFKDSYDKMISFANQAYKTAGLSANQYMEQVTSFSASLLQSLGGDTDKAANVADMAMRDMADNANKFGTNIEDIQHAYQGFAKQNYTMLDNLKLGYGGTKTEMERLLTDAEKISGVKYDINNLSDVYEAVHVIQQELGVTGTTAKEAEETFEGSFNSMKASLNNFLAALTLGDKASMSLSEALMSLISTTANFVFNNALPMIGNLATGLVTAIFTLLGSSSNGEIGKYVQKVFNSLTTFVTRQFPDLIIMGFESIGKFVSGLINALPQVLSGASTLTQSLISGFLERIPDILETGKTLILTLVQSFIDNLPAIVNGAVNLITTIISTIAQHFPDIILTGGKLIIQLGIGLLRQLPTLLAQIPGMLASIVGGFMVGRAEMISIGINLVKGLWQGIASVKDWIISKIGGFTKSVVKSMKKFFGIHSPSRIMRDEVGKYLAEGIGVGFSDGMPGVIADMEKSLPTSFDITPVVRFNSDMRKAQISDMHPGTQSESARNINQTFIFNEPYQSPADVARALRRESIKLGLAGDEIG